MSSEADKSSATTTIPLIDLSPWTSPEKASNADRDRVVQQVEAACREIGFFAIQHHGLDNDDSAVVNAAWGAARDFFDLPDATKLQSKTVDEAVYPYGYEQSERLTLGKELSSSNATEASESASPQPVDLKETFSIGPCNPAAGMPPRQFPSQPAHFQKALTDYYAAMEDLAWLLLKIFALGLRLPADFFQERTSHHLSALRILNYFAVAESADRLPGQVRAGAHTDYGALTILKSGGPGLQVKKDVVGEGAWVDVPHLENSYIINLGDLMQRWTNDEWVSTLHRVVLPAGPVDRRQSMAFFVNVNGDAIVQPFPTCTKPGNKPNNKYPPISARDHLMSKHLASMGVAAAAAAVAHSGDDSES